MRRREFFMIPAAAAVLTQTAQGAQIPRSAPELQFISHTGEQIKLSNYKGKKAVVIEFLLTTCPHCQKTAEMLSALQTRYAAKGLQVLGVAINPEARQQIPDFASEHSKNFPLGILSREEAASFLQHSAMLPFLMPQLVFIDRKGNIVEQQGGENEAWYRDQQANLRADIEKLLGGAPAPAKAPTKSSPAKTSRSAAKPAVVAQAK